MKEAANCGGLTFILAGEVPAMSAGGGRSKGSRNKLAAAFIEALHDDFNQNGVSAIERVRKEKPDVYIRVVASILPKELDVALNVNHGLSEEYQRALTHADATRILREAAGPAMTGGNG